MKRADRAGCMVLCGGVTSPRKNDICVLVGKIGVLVSKIGILKGG